MGELLAAVDIMELPDLPPETKESKKDDKDQEKFTGPQAGRSSQMIWFWMWLDDLPGQPDVIFD